jgi:NTP pyrophosphatase (non-canonical NTP hydrolase)
VKEILKEVEKFRDDRNWKPYHNSKDLALSISIEAAELLEDFQWISADEAEKRNMENIKEELADVMIYSLMMASILKLDPEDIIREKLEKNNRKYPANEEHKF